MQFTRSKRERIGRTTLAMFTVVWLNMAVQPCLMALESLSKFDGHGHHQDCPVCPDDGHGDHDGGVPAGSGCVYIDGYDYDGRVTKLPEPLFVGAFVPHAMPVTLESGFSDAGGRFNEIESKHVPPPRNLCFCVFLK